MHASPPPTHHAAAHVVRQRLAAHMVHKQDHGEGDLGCCIQDAFEQAGGCVRPPDVVRRKQVKAAAPAATRTLAVACSIVCTAITSCDLVVGRGGGRGAFERSAAGGAADSSACTPPTRPRPLRTARSTAPPAAHPGGLRCHLTLRTRGAGCPGAHLRAGAFIVSAGGAPAAGASMVRRPGGSV